MQLPTSQALEPDHPARHGNARVLVIIQLVRTLHAAVAYFNLPTLHYMCNWLYQPTPLHCHNGGYKLAHNIRTTNEGNQ